MAKHGAYRNTDTVPRDARGNAYDRAARKGFLLDQGDGWSVPCRWCGRRLTWDTLEVDRWPVCGHAGGSYRRDNIVPAFADCNRTRCSRRGAPCQMPGQLELVAREVAHAG